MRPVAIAVFTCATAPGSLVAALTKAGSIVFRAEQGAPTLTRLLVGVWTKRYLRQEWSSSNKQAVGCCSIQLCSSAPQHRVPACHASSSSDVSTPLLATAALGLVANPICLWSEFTLKTTGSGLPPGPGGALGAAEGVSYLVILGIVGWSIYSKTQTGSGLPAGPGGVVGAAEGFSYLSLAAGVVVAALNAVGI